MLDGVMLLWFILTALSVLFVAIDIRTTPEALVMKWGFVLFIAFTGPIGAFLYVLGCREPLPGLHEQYVSARWRQALGSTMHCVAGDGVGILVGAIIAAWIALPHLPGMALEYLLGFGFGWVIFQALFMKNMAGGSYAASLKSTFMPELLSMNVLMAGMMPAMTVPWVHLPAAHDPAQPAFWFRMSMALLFGFVCAYPMNWWLVARGLKHGMMTVRPAGHAGSDHAAHVMDGAHGAAPAHGPMHGGPGGTPRSELAAMTVLSLVLLAIGVFVAVRFGGH
jgi:Domain of unknown function (DUF4396)